MAATLWQLHHTKQNGCPVWGPTAATLPLTPTFLLQQLSEMFFLPLKLCVLPLLSAGLCGVEGHGLTAKALKNCSSGYHLHCPGTSGRQWSTGGSVPGGLWENQGIYGCRAVKCTCPRPVLHINTLTAHIAPNTAPKKARDQTQTQCGLGGRALKIKLSGRHLLRVYRNCIIPNWWTSQVCTYINYFKIQKIPLRRCCSLSISLS